MMTAFTAPGSFYPPYVNVSVRPEGDVRTIVRSKATDDGHCGACAEIVMSPDDFLSVFGPMVDELRERSTNP